MSYMANKYCIVLYCIVISLSVLQDVKAKCHVTVFCNCIIVIFPFNSRLFFADTSLWHISPKSFENLSDLQYL